MVSHLKAEKDTLRRVLEEIGNQDVSDGFQFTLDEVTDLPHAHMKYPGFTARFRALYGRVKETLDIDIGVGDIVDPMEGSLALLKTAKGPIFEDAIALLTYPPETIFAEKLQTSAARGATNSRMKDYYDLTMMLAAPGLLNKERTKKAITATFNHRHTKITNPLLQFDAGELRQLQSYWTPYHRKVEGHAPLLSKNIEEVINLINAQTLAIIG